ncbi:MAG: hypothetical protein KGJ89_05495 [Patescibacteria group bacterium]|nr:hypothetical protein [Patescibacteria group bacterium]MDE2227376.1 hypothetical protein [Patescibacteria group bacterium]
MPETNISVKSIIAALSSNIIDDPNRLSGYLILLTANLWIYGRDRMEAESKEAEKWAEVRKECETDGQANKEIKATEEWKKWQMAVVSEKTVLELIRSIKKRLQSIADEFKSY